MNSDEQAIAIVLALFVFVLVIAVLSYVVTAFFLMKIYRKMGIEGWKAWVPVYNQWVFLEAGKQQGWLSLLGLAGGLLYAIPFIGPLVGWVPSVVLTVFSCIAAYHIGRGFGKEDWWVVIYIFIGIVWLGILAFDDSKWRGSGPSAGPDQQPPQPPQWRPQQPAS